MIFCICRSSCCYHWYLTSFQFIMWGTMFTIFCDGISWIFSGTKPYHYIIPQHVIPCIHIFTFHTHISHRTSHTSHIVQHISISHLTSHISHLTIFHIPYPISYHMKIIISYTRLLVLWYWVVVHIYHKILPLKSRDLGYTLNIVACFEMSWNLIMYLMSRVCHVMSCDVMGWCIMSCPMDCG